MWWVFPRLKTKTQLRLNWNQWNKFNLQLWEEKLKEIMKKKLIYWTVKKMGKVIWLIKLLHMQRDNLMTKKVKLNGANQGSVTTVMQLRLLKVLLLKYLKKNRTVLHQKIIKLKFRKFIGKSLQFQRKLIKLKLKK